MQGVGCRKICFVLTVVLGVYNMKINQELDCLEGFQRL
jgi:hypothetical protein